MGEERPVETTDIQQQAIIKIGCTGTGQENWDNGFYVGCKLGNISLKFLLDSGSTSSLISNRAFQRINNNQKPVLNQKNYVVHDVNGRNLCVYGCADVCLEIGNSEYTHQVIVCDMTPDGILGQDFLLKYVKKIDYHSYRMHTQNDIVQCWSGGESDMVCRVLVKETVVIPPYSGM